MNVETPASEDLSHILGIISSLLSNLPSESPNRIRLLAKFVEEGYEKVDKLIELRDGARKRLNMTEAEVEVDRQAILASEGDEGSSSDAEDAFYIRRLDGGLFTLQTVDCILGWLIMEDDGIRTHTLRMLDRRNQSLQDILRTLRLAFEHADDEAIQAEDSMSHKDILQGLISALGTTHD